MYLQKAVWVLDLLSGNITIVTRQQGLFFWIAISVWCNPNIITTKLNNTLEIPRIKIISTLTAWVFSGTVAEYGALMKAGGWSCTSITAAETLAMALSGLSEVSDATRLTT